MMIHQSSGYTVQLLTSEKFRLDGGAMFGSVPKALWSKRLPADDNNRIPMCCNVLLLDGHGRKVLVDLGLGRKWNEKEFGIYAIEYCMHSPLEIIAAGVTDLLVTHLHFDHVGGISRINAEGNVEPSFPGAQVIVSARNFEHAQHCGVRERASYLPANIDILKSCDLRLSHHGEEVLPNIKVHYANGHTHGLQWVQIGNGQGAIAFPSDVIPTAHHLPIPYVMGYDLSAETAMRDKELFLQQALAEDWIVVFEHDTETKAATLREEKGKVVVAKHVEL